MISKYGIAALWWVAAAWAQPNLAGIAHVAFRVADLDAARGFYNRLGFEQFFAMKQGERTTEAFLKINDRQFIELYPRTEGSQPLGLMHVCYESSDLEALHGEYQRRGLAVSDVRKAGAGNLLMTMKDPEGQTIEFTQYMPGSRHYEDRGKHLGANRVSRVLIGVTTVVRDAAAVRTFYVEKLGFTTIGAGAAVWLRVPGDSGQELQVAAKGTGGILLAVPDLKRAMDILKGMGLRQSGAPAPPTVSDPDGVEIEFAERN